MRKRYLILTIRRLRGWPWIFSGSNMPTIPFIVYTPIHCKRISIQWVPSPIYLFFLSHFSNLKLLPPPVLNPKRYLRAVVPAASVSSRHYIRDLSLYTKSFLRGFGTFYGDPRKLVHFGFAAFLPGTKKFFPGVDGG